MRIGDFLRARRGALQPEDVGLVREPGRRVPGLRREEVADLAGISAEYYLRLEQGRDHCPSPQVMAAIARALRLDAAARGYLSRLITDFLRRDESRTEGSVDPGLALLVDRLVDVPAFIADANRDVVASNALARTVSGGVLAPGRNLLLHAFDPRVKTPTPEWERSARRAVAALRWSSDPDDPRLQEVIGTLAVRDDDFRRWWSAHEVAVTGVVDLASIVLARPPGTRVDCQEFSVPEHPGHVLAIVHDDSTVGADVPVRAPASPVARGGPGHRQADADDGEQPSSGVHQRSSSTCTRRERSSSPMRAKIS